MPANLPLTATGVVAARRRLAMRERTGHGVLTLGRNDNHEAVWNNYMRAGYATWPVGFECDYHSHEDAAETFTFVSGACEITIEGEIFWVEAGQTVYVGPGVRHKLKAIGDEPMSMFMVVAPNHSPTHTFYDDSGVPVGRERPTPGDDWHVVS
jgi:mannose-6-phosphate isomerase-like protein (cupin superfamily)